MKASNKTKNLIDIKNSSNCIGMWVKKSIACGLITTGFTLVGFESFGKAYAKSIDSQIESCVFNFQPDEFQKNLKYKSDEILSLDDFYEKTRAGTVVVKFWSYMVPRSEIGFSEDSIKNNQDIKFYTFNIDNLKNKHIEELDIYVAPTTIVYKNGRELRRFNSSFGDYILIDRH